MQLIKRSYCSKLLFCILYLQKYCCCYYYWHIWLFLLMNDILNVFIVIWFNYITYTCTEQRTLTLWYANLGKITKRYNIHYGQFVFNKPVEKVLLYTYMHNLYKSKYIIWQDKQLTVMNYALTRSLWCYWCLVLL